MLEKYIPDVDAYLSYWIELSVLTQNKMQVEANIEKLHAEIISRVVATGQKPPSMAQIERTVLITGTSKEEEEALDKLRKELQYLEGQILELRGRIKTEEMKQALFQTMSANARNVVSLEGGL